MTDKNGLLPQQQTRNEIEFNIYVLGRDTLAVVGNGDTWQIGLLVRLAHAPQSTILSGKRRRAILSCLAANRNKKMKKDALRVVLQRRRFYYLAPYMRYAIQLDVSLVFGRKLLRNRLITNYDAVAALSLPNLNQNFYRFTKHRNT